MKINYTLKSFSFLFLATLFMLSCSNERKDKEKVDVTETTVVKKTGYQHYLEYISMIQKPIGAEKTSYQNGYRMHALLKAQKDLSTFGQQQSAASGSNFDASLITVIERGPNNIPGRGREVFVDPNDNDTWYATTAGGGFWVTRDAGATWASLTDFTIPSLATSTAAIFEGNTDIIYLGTGEPFGNADAIDGIGLIRTTDGGVTWDYLENSINVGNVGRIVVNPNDSDHVVIGTSNGVFVTLDGGNTFTQTFTTTRVDDINPDPNNFFTLYAGANGLGIIRSTDGGQTWSTVLNRSDLDRFELDVSPVNTNRVVVAAYSQTGGDVAVNTSFFLSDDGGNTFTSLAYTGTLDANIIGGQGWYDNIITMHPLDANIAYFGGINLYKLTIAAGATSYDYENVAISNNGATQGQINGLVHPDQHGIAIAVDGGNIQLIVNNDGGIYSTGFGPDPGVLNGDFGTDPAFAFGLRTTQFYGADKENGADNYAAGAQDNGTSYSLNGNTQAATNYTRAFGGDGFETIWNYDNTDQIMGSIQFSQHARTINRGANVVAAFHGDSGDNAVAPFYSKLANANNNPDVVFSVTANGVWRSEDFGGNWELISIPSAGFDPGGISKSALDVEVSTANPNIVWTGSAMTESGNFTLLVSTDNGATYTRTTGTFQDNRPGFDHNQFISGIEISYTDPGTAYALFGSQGLAKILRTTDLGQNWEDITGFSTNEDRGFPDVTVHSALEMPFDSNIIWAGTDVGVFQTMDGGATWAQLTNIPPVSVFEMKVVNDQVVMATHGLGVWTATVPELAGYEPPEFVKPPVVVSAVQEGISEDDGIITFSYENNQITAVRVLVDGVEAAMVTSGLAPNTPITVEVENLAEGIRTIGLEGIIGANNVTLPGEGELVIIDFNQTQDGFSIPEFIPQDVFTFNNEFVVSTINIFPNSVLNNASHPYANQSESRTVLRTPILVSDTDGTFTYEDVAITEPTFDFVFIEGSTDLQTWTVLDQYDADRFPEWRAAYDANNSNPTITPDLLRQQSINLLDTYADGDVVAIRFRLVSDQAMQSFGWAINSLLIQSSLDDAFLAADNISVETVSETCPGLENGIVNVEVNARGLNYSANLTGNGQDVTQAFTDETSFSDIPVGAYTVCITIDGQADFERCFAINIDAAAALNIDFGQQQGGANNVFSININEGTPPFDIRLNGELIRTTSETSFELTVDESGLLEVETSRLCEGTFSISLEGGFDEIIATPNPVINELTIRMPTNGLGAVPVSVFNVSGQMIYSRATEINNSSVQVPFGNLPSGIYFVRLDIENPIVLKIVK